MNLKKIVFICLLFPFTDSFVNAQTNTTAKKDTANSKSSVDAMVYNPSMVKSSFTNKYVDSTKNALKINPILIPFGVFPIYYERKIAKRFSIEAGVGITFTDFLYEFYSNDSFSPNGTTVIGKSGYSLEGSIRYYMEYSSQAIDGYYFSPDVWYRTYNKSMAVENANGIPTGSFYNDSRNVLSLQLVVGNQNTDNALYLDWYVGIGIAKTSLNTVKYEMVSTSYGSAIQTEIIPSQSWNAIFSLGLNIGFGF
ncbi:MAG TPA: hypothetical protein VNG53_11805 [Bacteroidia bacterium]|nr:hypothetical protein [Bacteroidia bacterium]